MKLKITNSIYLAILLMIGISIHSSATERTNAELFMLLPDTCIGTVPTQPGGIMVSGGIARVCAGETRTYTTATAVGVTWQWTVPGGATINSGQGTNSINVIFGAGFTANGVLSVVKVNACGNSNPRMLTISRNVPSTPGTIAGNRTSLCGQTNVAYSVANVSGVIYTWTVPAGVTIVNGQNTNAITVNYPLAPFSGNIAVYATNYCGKSGTRTASVKGSPAIPAAINAPACVAPMSINNIFSISPVVTANGYTWEGPVGSHITANGVTSVNNILTTTSTTVSVSFGALTAMSAIRVRANSLCGNTTPRVLTLSLCSLRSGESDALASVELYPSPANQNIVLRMNTAYCSSGIITITDMLGNQITSYAFDANQGTTEQSFEVSEFAKGIYLARITVPGASKVIRFIKH